VNSISISGVLGKDSELRATKGGEQVLNFSMAYGQGKEKPAIWWSCTLWGRRAELLHMYLCKGQQVTVIGSVSERVWTDKDGLGRKSFEVKVNEIALQSGRSMLAEKIVPATENIASENDAEFDADIPF
jgi:single-strand DNA-binding protein